VKGLSEVDFVITRPDFKKIRVILHRVGLTIEDLKCSICEEDLSDLKHLRAIFPYGSAIVCCDKMECLIACRDKLIARASK
jgi:hypothetical protein